jgi:hypothetical protein
MAEKYLCTLHSRAQGIELPTIMNDIIEELSNSTNDIFFKIQIFNGQVYGICQSETKINGIIQNKLKDTPISFKMNINICHIPIVLVNDVNDIGLAEIEDFIKPFDQEFTVTLGRIMPATTLLHFYADIECHYINDFLKVFNQKYNKNIEIPKQIPYELEDITAIC